MDSLQLQKYENLHDSESKLVQIRNNHQLPTEEELDNRVQSYLSGVDNNHHNNEIETKELINSGNEKDSKNTVASCKIDEFSSFLEENDERAELSCGLNRSKKSSVRQLSRCATNIIALISFITVWKIGMAFENWHTENAPSTTPLYKTQEVCAAVMSEDKSKLDFMTFDNENAIPKMGNTTTKIAHCGGCGSCSNVNDIGIYKRTTQTLYQNAKICTYRFLIGGRRGMKRCMTKRTTFTPACLDCWVDNMMCDWQLCVFVCLKYSISMMVDRFRNAGHHDLNPCLQCDEKRCGPAFLKCAGANRRRCGIISDINRDVDHEVCTKVQL